MSSHSLPSDKVHLRTKVTLSSTPSDKVRGYSPPSDFACSLLSKGSNRAYSHCLVSSQICRRMVLSNKLDGGLAVYMYIYV